MKVKVTLTIEEEIVKELKIHAIKKGVTLSDLLAYSAHVFIDHEEGVELTHGKYTFGFKKK